MSRTVLISGGAGFIGANAALHFRGRGWRVALLDDLSRRGTERNLAWLRKRGDVSFTSGDIRDFGQVRRWFARRGAADLVLHLAAQVAVTTSVEDPRTDFEINALGTFNMLEAARGLRRKPYFIYSSTNKVYGGMEDVRVRRKGGRYAYAGLPHGVPESRPLDFHSPYGCSKGAGDQYVRDYERIYGLPTVVLRQSCIYGSLQRGNEDQGWVAHFLKSALEGRPVTIYGDGRQVRDVLEVSDLVAAFERCWERRAGGVFNIGGGPSNTLSLRELLDWIRARGGRLKTRTGGWRPGDQRIYVSDIRKASRVLGWRPKIGVPEGLERLWSWLGSPEAR